MELDKLAVYPGSFDPVTCGHIDIIERASQIFPRLIVAVVGNPAKKTLFTLEERTEMIRSVTKQKRSLLIDHFDGLLMDFVAYNKAQVIIRGLRAISDFEYEFQMALSNKVLCDSVETVFLMSRPEYSFVSSRLIKEIAVLGGDIRSFVPDLVAERLNEKLH